MLLGEQIKIICLQEDRGFSASNSSCDGAAASSVASSFFIESYSVVSSFNNEEEGSTNDDEVDNCTQEVTVSDTVPWQFREVFNVSSFNNWVKDNWSDNITYKWSDDSVEGSSITTATARSRNIPPE